MFGILTVRADLPAASLNLFRQRQAFRAIGEPNFNPFHNLKTCVLVVGRLIGWMLSFAQNVAFRCAGEYQMQRLRRAVRTAANTSALKVSFARIAGSQRNLYGNLCLASGTGRRDFIPG